MELSFSGLTMSSGLSFEGQIWQKALHMQPYIMVHNIVQEPGDVCWHISFALWIYGLGLICFQHEVHVWIHPFQASQCPVDWLLRPDLEKTLYM